MSRVSFTTQHNGKEVTVVGGYDRPLNYYHLTVFNPEDDEEETSWSGLDNFSFDQMRDLDYAKNQLQNMGITPPDGFWDLCEQKLGNVFWEWSGVEWVNG